MVPLIAREQPTQIATNVLGSLKLFKTLNETSSIGCPNRYLKVSPIEMLYLPMHIDKTNEIKRAVAKETKIIMNLRFSFL